MAGPERKRPVAKSRLAGLPPVLPGRSSARGPIGVRNGKLEEDSIYTLRGYKAWAARVKAAWDAES